MDNFVCNDAFECSNSSVAQECYEENNFREQTFFCDCSNWFGWVGEKCDEPSSTIYYLRATVPFFCLWNLFNLFAHLNVAYVYLKYNYPKKPADVSVNLILYVAVLESLTSVCYLSYEVTQSFTFFDATLYEPAVGNSLLFESSGVQRSNRVATDALALFGGLFHGFASLLIIISWLDVFDNLNKIFIYKGFLSEKRIKTIVLVIMTVLSTVFILLFTFKAVAEVNFVYILAAGLLAISYLIGYFRFKKRINKLIRGELDESIKHTLRSVKESSLVNTLCFTGVVLLSVVYYYGIVFHLEILKIGSFNYFFIAIDLIFSFGMLSVTYNSYYGHRINLTLLNANYTRDGKNIKIKWIPIKKVVLRIITLCKKNKDETFDSFSTQVMRSNVPSRKRIITVEDL